MINRDIKLNLSNNSEQEMNANIFPHSCNQTHTQAEQRSKHDTNLMFK